MTKSQIKTSNLTLKIQKLAKGLNKFTINDIWQIIPADKKEISLSLCELEKNNIVKKVSETEYLFIKLKELEELERHKALNISQKTDSLRKRNIISLSKIDVDYNPLSRLPDTAWLTMSEVCQLTGEKQETVRRKCKNRKYISKYEREGKYKHYFILKASIKDYENLSKVKNTKNTTPKIIKIEKKSHIFDKKAEQEIYDAAPDFGKKQIEKFMTLFKLAQHLNGARLKKFLADFIEVNPDYKISYSTFLKKKNDYIRYGLSALIPRYGNQSKNRSIIPQNMYDAFKKLYLSPKGYSCNKCIKLLIEKGFEDASIPAGKTFTRLLYKEYSKDYIRLVRNPPIDIPDLKFESTTAKIPEIQKTTIQEFKKYITAANAYYEKLCKMNSDLAVCRIGYVKNHLNPFFKDYKITNITNDVIKKYINVKRSEGFARGSIKRFLATLADILKKYASKNDIHCSPTLDTLFRGNEGKILSDKEINKIISENDMQKLWIICLGLVPSELAGLEYSDIDFEKHTVNINKFLNTGIVSKHRKEYKIRTLKLPDILFNKIKKNKTGRIFKSVDINDYNILINTHIKLLIRKNIQINIISKNMGLACLNDFMERFCFLLPQELDNDFEILKG